MKHFSGIFTGLMTLFMVSTLAADDCWDGCCESRSPHCGFSFHADYLYWCPCVNGLAVAMKQEKQAPQKFNNIEFIENDIVLEGVLIDRPNVTATDDILLTGTTSLLGFNFCDSAMIKEKGEYLTDNCESGVRVGLSYHVPCTCWGINFSWIGYHPNGKKSIEADDEDETFLFPYNGLALQPFVAKANFRQPVTHVMLPGLESPPTNGPVTVVLKDISSPEPTFESPVPTELRFNKVNAHWDLHLNIYDLEFGRDFACGCFAFRPHADLRFANIDQELRVKSMGFLVIQRFDLPSEADSADAGLATLDVKQTYKNEFCGVGPRFGMNAEWDVFCGVGLYGNFALSLLYGDRDSSHKEKVKRETLTQTNGFPRLYPDVFVSGDLDGDFDYHRKNNHDCVSAVTDVELGLIWDWCVCGGCFGGTVKLGWEHHYFFNQGIGHVIDGSTTMPGDNRDLAVHGLVASVGFGF